MRMRPVRFLVLLLAALGTGCSRMIEYRPGHRPRLDRAPATGVYALYERGTKTAVCDTVLLKRDRVGFARDGQGRLVAVAADQRTPLREAAYRWRFEGYGGKAAEPGSPGSGLDALAGDLLGALIESAIEGGADAAWDAADRAIEKQSIT
jgi:hypothetical protein